MSKNQNKGQKQAETHVKMTQAEANQANAAHPSNRAEATAGEQQTDLGKGDAAETAKASGKSIIDPKYRAKYKDPDWLAQQMTTHGSTFKEVTTGEGNAKTTKQVPTGVDVDKVFKLARENGLDVDKYEAQRAGHGFAGRFRMTVRNMLQPIVKQRHGFWANGKFVEADPQFLKNTGAPSTPTHDQKGAKIAVKVEEPAKAA